MATEVERRIDAVTYYIRDARENIKFYEDEIREHEKELEDLYKKCPHSEVYIRVCVACNKIV